MTVKSSPCTSRLHIRLTEDERMRLEADATKEGTTVSDLVRARALLRLTEDERTRLEADATKEGTTVSDLVRARLLRQPVPRVRAAMTRVSMQSGFQAMDPVLFAQLSRLGNNLNQLARAFNSGQDVDRAEIMRFVSHVCQTMLSDEVTARYVTVAVTKVRQKEMVR